MKLKSLMRWCLALGVAGMTLGGPGLQGIPAALALTEEQVSDVLQAIPVFAVTSGEGGFIAAEIPTQSGGNATGETRSITGIFIYPQDAEAFINRLNQNNPDLGNQVRVTPFSLGDIYTRDRRNAAQPGQLDFSYEANASQVALAEETNNSDRFLGVPLFVARVGDEGGSLTIRQDGEEFTPLFFEKARLEAIVEQLRGNQPDLANSVQIQAIPLEGFIQFLERTEDAAIVERLVIIPPKASLDYIEQLRQQREQQGEEQ